MVLAMTTAVFAAPAAQSNIDYEFVPLAYDSYDSTDFRGKADYYVIVNCRQWVTLRSRPSVYGDDLAHIPLGTKVLVSDVQSRNGFLPVQYGSLKGYVLEKYLKFVSMS